MGENVSVFLSKVYLDGTGRMEEFLSIKDFHKKYGWGDFSPEDAEVMNSVVLKLQNETNDPVLTTYHPEVTLRYPVKLLSVAYCKIKDAKENLPSTQEAQ